MLFRRTGPGHAVCHHRRRTSLSCEDRSARDGVGRRVGKGARRSGLPDLLIIMPISGKPEIGAPCPRGALVGTLRFAHPTPRKQGGGRNVMRIAPRWAAALALSAVVIASSAQAQDYPSRYIRVIVGPGPDHVARLFGPKMTEALGQQVVVEPRPGAGGNLALQAVARAPADGYTLLMTATPHAVNVTLYEKSTITVTRGIVPVASINNDSFVLLTNPSFAAKTVPEFIAYAKANPGRINLGSSGTGNLSHLSSELFRMMTGIEVVHVPYRGTPAAHSALLAGDVHAVFDAIGSAVPQIQAGALRALGVTSTTRLR